MAATEPQSHSDDDDDDDDDDEEDVFVFNDTIEGPRASDE